jgi:hypothetical protein
MQCGRLLPRGNREHGGCDSCWICAIFLVTCSTARDRLGWRDTGVRTLTFLEVGWRFTLGEKDSRTKRRRCPMQIELHAGCRTDLAATERIPTRYRVCYEAGASPVSEAR